MTSDPAKRSDDETEAETVRRRLIDAVCEQLDELQREENDEDQRGPRE